MIFAKKIILKDGRECTIRNASEADGKEVLDLFVLTHSQTDYLLSYPDEVSFTAEDEARFLKGMEKSDNEAELVAQVDGSIVGTAGIERIGTMYKTKHRADFGICVKKGYWGLGIGRALTDACIECARQAGYYQLELQAVAENECALELYRKTGFKEYGRNPRGFRSRFTGWQELVLMRLELDR